MLVVVKYTSRDAAEDIVWIMGAKCIHSLMIQTNFLKNLNENNNSKI